MIHMFPPQFMAMDPGQREAVWRALKEDGEKLLSECGTTDRDMRRLQDELRQCEHIYEDLCNRAAAQGQSSGMTCMYQV